MSHDRQGRLLKQLEGSMASEAATKTAQRLVCLLSYADRWTDEEIARLATDIDAEFAPLLAAKDERIERLETALETINQTLTVPAAEYVPAIGEVFTIIDLARKR